MVMTLRHRAFQSMLAALRGRVNRSLDGRAISAVRNLKRCTTKYDNVPSALPRVLKTHINEEEDNTSPRLAAGRYESSQ